MYRLKEMEEAQLNGSVAEGSAAQMNIQTTKKLKKPKGVFINYYISQCKLNTKNKAKMTLQARRELGEKWKQLSLKEKEPFIKQTIKQRKQYKQELEEGFDGYKREKVVSTRCSPLNLFKLFEQLKERKKETVSKEFGKSNFIPRISVWGKHEVAKLSSTKDVRTTLETKSTEEVRKSTHAEIQNMKFGKDHHRKSSTESPSMAKSVPESNDILVIDDDGKGNHSDLYTTTIVSIDEPCSVCPSPRKRKAEKKNCLIKIPTKVGDLERALCNYIWNSGVDGSEIVLNYGVTYATIDEFESLRPEKWVTSNIIDLSALMVAYKSKDMPISTKKCFFPSTFATHILSHECTANEVIKFYQCHFNQMGSLSQYDQVFIPINEGNEHWYLCVIDMLHMEAKLLDSLPLRRGNTERRKVVARLISCCETLFKDPLMISTLGSLVVPFEDLKIVVPEGVPFQSNGYDCGMFVIKFMQHLPTENYCSVRVKPWDRFLLLYEIINHKENMCRGKVCKAAMKLQNRRQSPPAKQDCKSVLKF
ncbi:hypothetical protein V6N11_006092 [Hibiscus sabdariffa]|uniref:Ubiquitin-like protease family profile domain-containing protein n=1 Tax=Hibiscus sabdariffa TaxID=183260 RepID=A0ABR2RQ19_9ROSI